MPSTYPPALLTITLLLTGCAPEQTSPEQDTFLQACRDNGHGWMKMSEMKNGMITGPACLGCMPDNENHLCNQKDYETYLNQ